MDAFKHIPEEFNLKLMNALHDYSVELYQRPLTFFCENLIFPVDKFYPFFNYVPYDALTRYFKEHARSQVFFIDFPRAFATRALVEDPSYGFNMFMEFIKYREGRELLAHYIAEGFNHDFQGRIAELWKRKLIYVLLEYFSDIPAIIFHGEESRTPPETARGKLDFIDGEGEVGQMLANIRSAFEGYRTHASFNKSKIHQADHNFMAVSKTIAGKTFLLIANKGDQPRTFDIRTSQSLQPDKLRWVADSDGAEGRKRNHHVHHDSFGHHFDVAPHSVILLELEQELAPN
jgi:hypothetical protein